jgi:hypothetical protein
MKKLLLILCLSFVLISCSSNQIYEKDINIESENLDNTLYENETFLQKENSYHDRSEVDNLIDWLNNDFIILNNSQTMNYWDFTYWEKEGTVNDLFRLFVNMLHKGSYEAVMLVYETNEGFDTVAVYRDKEPMYLYYDNGFKSVHHGYSFNDLIEFEEDRINKKIIKYGIITEVNTMKPKKISILDVEEWIFL